MSASTFAEKIAAMTMAELEGAAMAANLLPDFYTDNDRAMIREAIFRKMKEAGRGKR